MQPQNPDPLATLRPSHKSLVAAIILAVLFIAAAGFGTWAYSGKKSAENNLNSQVATAMAAAKQAQAAADQASFADQLKAPYQTFTGSPTYGAVTFSYPKTWSAYVDTSSSDEPINGYFYPGIVPATGGNTAYALRVELVSDSYSDVISQFSDQIQAGSLKATVYVPTKLANNSSVQRGTRFDGKLNDTQTGAEIVIPVRAQTLEIYTQSTDYLNDFNQIILPSLSFTP